ncbi:MAG: hypothetical protein PWQ91_1325 [Eubacteriales bacterium]|nr:hypothetical protein [Eubacteriales bacterium]
MAPKIRGEECVGCGTCVSVCPQGVWELKDDKAYQAFPEKCSECGSCVENCPVQCIYWE